MAQGAVFLIALMDLAKILYRYGLLNNEFKAWLARKRRIARGDAKATVEFLESSERLPHHAGRNAHYKGLSINIPLSLMIMGDALN